MKKVTVALSLAIVLMLTLVTPVLAAPPGEEAWQCASFNNGTTTAGYNINTTNLQVSSFWINNNSNESFYLYILKNSELIFELRSSPNSGLVSKAINNFKFQRIPATDPDDPNSIRYPNGVSIFMRSE